MSSIKTRLYNARSKLLRRGSATSTATRSIASSAGSERQPQADTHTASLRKSLSLSKLPKVSSAQVTETRADERMVKSELLQVNEGAEPESVPDATATAVSSDSDRHPQPSNNTSIITTSPIDPRAAASSDQSPAIIELPPPCPKLTLQEPTPVHPIIPPPELEQQLQTTPSPSASTDPEDPIAPLPPRNPARSIPQGPIRRQSVVANTDATIITSLLAPDLPAGSGGTAVNFSANMLHRKIWVMRPNASPTIVQIREDDLVDDVRDMILKKYHNSLGRSFDSPDVTLRIVPRDAHKGQERVLGPEEEMCRTLDAYYPGGQNVKEALIISVPQKRTPKPSPQVPTYYAYHDDHTNHNTEYFPPMPVVNPSPAALGAVQHDPRIPLNHAPHSISVINTGHIAPLPSPGSTRRGPLHAHRPKYPRHNTASPTTLTGSVHSAAPAPRPTNRPRHDSSASEAKNSATSNNPIPTPPAQGDPNSRSQSLQTSNPPTPRVSSPLPTRRKKKKQPIEPPSLPAGLLDGSVPPINVLIVEDNIINLRVLGAFMQRLKVRWQRAMNGKEAVTKWKAGGFHLVLMDIQLPVMNGLEATKEIRRLERVNSIGVFSSGSSEAPNQLLEEDRKTQDELNEDDKLGDKALFKSPVIIVALTASSLQSDRHEALAAGCNDFLTKPVNFVWLERKVKEWGCMQALIDFDGWRKWKDFADKSENNDSTKKLSGSYHSVAPSKKSIAASPTVNNAEVNGIKKEDGAEVKEKERERKSKRKSVGIVPPPVLPEEVETPPDVDSGTN